jgi:hypothetical protein
MLCQVIGLPEAALWTDLPDKCPLEWQSDPKKNEAFQFLVKWVEEYRRRPRRGKHPRLLGELANTPIDGDEYHPGPAPRSVNPAADDMNKWGIPPASDDWLFTEDEAAFLLNMTPGMIAQRRRAGKIASIRDGRHYVRYKKKHLFAYMLEPHRNARPEELNPTAALKALEMHFHAITHPPRRRSSKTKI